MSPADIISIIVIALIVGAATAYIIHAKRSGKKCIGCPDGKTCGGNCSCCAGCCSLKDGEKANKSGQK